MLHVICYMLSSQDQLKNQIESAEEILILTAEKPTRDAVAASWALSHLLQSLGKKPTVLQMNAADFFFLSHSTGKNGK